MEARYRAPTAGGRHPVRQQDRRNACRDGRSRFEARDGVARVFDQGPSLRPAADHDRGGVQGRRHRQGRRGLAACDEAARPEGQGYRAGSGRSVFGRLFRPGGGEGPQAGQRRVLLAQGPQGQWLRASDRRRGRARRSDREQDRPTGRRARHHSDPEEIAQLRPRLDPANPQGRQAAGCRAEGRPELHGRRLEGRLAELVVPRRLDRARGSCAAPDRLSRS